MEITLGQQYNVREKPSVILYIYITVIIGVFAHIGVSAHIEVFAQGCEGEKNPGSK